MTSFTHHKSDNLCNEITLNVDTIAPFTPEKCMSILTEIGGIYGELMKGATGIPMDDAEVRRVISRMHRESTVVYTVDFSSVGSLDNADTWFGGS